MKLNTNLTQNKSLYYYSIFQVKTVPLDKEACSFPQKSNANLVFFTRRTTIVSGAR